MKHKKKIAKLNRRRADWLLMKDRGDTKPRQRYMSGGYREPGSIKQ